jgi:hypothetical protein
MIGVRVLWFASLLCLVAGTPAVAQGVFAGTWQVADAQVATWHRDDPNYTPTIDPKFRHATFVFKKDRLIAPAPFNCKAHYEIKTVEPGYLFQGAFDQDDPAGHAKALGFKSDKIVNLDFTCLRNDADIEMDFHLVDRDTAIFGLNNVIYTMKRRPAK